MNVQRFKLLNKRSRWLLGMKGNVPENDIGIVMKLVANKSNV